MAGDIQTYSYGARGKLPSLLERKVAGATTQSPMRLMLPYTVWLKVTSPFLKKIRI